MKTGGGMERRSNRGGRPRKEVRLDQKLTVMCTLPDRKVIEARAGAARLTVSEYLRKVGLAQKVSKNEKVLPGEVLAFAATLNHLAATLDGIARKRSGPDELDALQRAELHFFSGQFKQLAKEIKYYIR